MENLKLLQEEEVSLAIVQGGTSSMSDQVELSSLASLYLEPVWLFYREEFGAIDKLSDLKGKRVGIGSPGSG